MESCELDSSGSGLRPVVRSCEHGDEHSDSVKDGNLLTSCVTVIFHFKLTDISSELHYYTLFLFRYIPWILIAIPKLM